MQTTTDTIISQEEVDRLAKLSGLSLDADQSESVRTQLGETINYIKNLEELDTSAIAATSHPGTAINVTFEDGAPADRTLSQADATANGKNVVGNMFEVNEILKK